MKTTLLWLLMLNWQPAEITAYCACEKCCGTDSPNITASGYRIQPNDKFVAAQKSVPFGTKIFIPNYGWTIVRDRGGAIKGNRLDVFFDSHTAALQWGRVKTQVIFVKNPQK